jgi:trigger factor
VFSKIKLSWLAKADDESVQEALTSSATARTTCKKTQKPKDGDQVIFDFLGKVDGRPFEGGAAGHALEQDSQFIQV